MDSPSNSVLSSALAVVQANSFPGSTPFAKMHLAKAAFTPSPTLDYSTLTAIEADFTGYSAQILSTFVPAHLDKFGQELLLVASPLFWEATDNVSPNQIYGYWILDKSSSPVASALFPAPIPMTGAGATLALNWGWAIAPWQFTAILLP